MKTQYEKPKTARGKIVFFFWHNLPRFILLVLVGLIIVLSVTISDKKSAIQAEH